MILPAEGLIALTFGALHMNANVLGYRQGGCSYDPRVQGKIERRELGGTDEKRWAAVGR